MAYVETNGIETYYERHGDGQPIVFAHGLGMDYRTWEPQLAEFADEYELLAYDVRGHGETEMGDPSDVTVQTLAEDLRALLRRADRRRVRPPAPG